MDIASDNDFVPQSSLVVRDNGHGGSRKRERMDLDSNSSSQMDDCDSYTSQRSDAPKLKSARHDPVYQYDNSYRFRAGSQSSTNSDNDTTTLLHSQSQPELLSSSNNTLRKRERSSDALENKFSQRIAIAPPLTPYAANITATTTNSTSAAAASASASNAWSLKSRVGEIATPGSSDREDGQVYTSSTSEEVATGSSDASGGGGDVNYSLMNSILRDLRLGRQQEQERQQEHQAGLASSPSQRHGQGQGSRCTGGSGGGRWSSRTRLAPASTIGATTTSSSSSDVPASSSDLNLLSLQRRFLLDYEKRMKEEDEASHRSSHK